MKKILTVGAFLETTRKQNLKISQAEMARKMRLTSAAINKIEHDTLKVSIKRLDQVCEAYGLTDEGRDELISLCGFSEADFFKTLEDRKSKFLLSDEELVCELLRRPKHIRDRIILTIQSWDSFKENNEVK